MQLKKIKVLAKDSLIYGVSGIVSRMIAVFLVPVYTRIFAPADYGIINLVNTTFMLVGLLAVCALDTAAARWYYDTNDQDHRKTTFASWFWFQLAVSILFAILSLLLSPIAFNGLLEIPLTRDTILIWLLPSCALISNILPVMIWNWFRLNQKPVATVLFTLSQSLLTVGLTILFVVVFRWHITGVYAALFLSTSFFSIIAFVLLKEWIAWRFFSMQRVKEMLRFSMPLVPAALAFWVLNATGSYFLVFYTTKTEVGLFSIGASLASVVTLFTGSFQQAWGPFAFSIINEPDAKKTYAQVFLIFGICASVILLSMFLFSREALQLFTTEQYYTADWVASILSINTILMASTYIASIGASIMKDTKSYSVGVMIGAVLTIAFNMALIPWLGKEGAAISMVLAQVVSLAYIFHRSQRLFHVEYRFVTAATVMGLAIVLGCAARIFIHDLDIVIRIVVKSCVLLIFVAMIGLLLRKEIQRLVDKLRATVKNA